MLVSLNGMKSAILSIGAVLFLNVAQADPSVANGSFESGNFTNWTVYNPTGEVSTDYAPPGTYLPAGSLAVVYSNFNHLPIQGNYFARIGTGNNYFDTPPGPPTFYNIYCCQPISLDAGDHLSGWAFFYNGDYAAQDSAWVRVFDGDGNEIANPWLEMSGQNNPDAAFQASTGWTHWDWQGPAPGLSHR